MMIAKRKTRLTNQRSETRGKSPLKELSLKFLQQFSIIIKYQTNISTML